MAPAGTLEFGQGETSASFTVTILDDGSRSNNKSLQLTLANPQGGGALGTPATATFWIVAP